MASKKPTYAEPTEYFPKEIRKKYGLGEFAKKDNSKAQSGKTPTKKPTSKKR